MNATPKCKLIACDVFRKEISALLAARGRAPEDYDAEFVTMALHVDPPKLREELARRVAEQRGRGYAAVLLAFGLCSNGTAGLCAPGVPLVIARMHDCITALIGSRERFNREHEAEPGTYWFARGFLHNEEYGPGEVWGFAGAGAEDAGQETADADDPMSEWGGAGAGPLSPERRAELLRRLVERYGEDNAEYLAEIWLDSWKKNYRRALFLAWEADPDVHADRARVRGYAEENGWRYEERAVDFGLLEGLLFDGWKDSEAYVVVPAEGRLEATHDGRVVEARTDFGRNA